MTKAGARAQLGSLIKDREALLDPEDPEEIYMADIEALQMAIGWLREGGGGMFTEGEMAGIIRAQDELLQYRELGTLEECREAVGRQRAKKIKRRMCTGCKEDCTNCEDYYNRCPSCNEGLGRDSGELFKHCPGCGQHIDWSE